MRKKTFRYLRAGLLLAVTVGTIGLFGCASSPDRSRTAGQFKEDKKLASNIQDALTHASVYKYPDVTVTAYRGRVQLSGFVTTEGQKEEAAKIASQTPGVAQVENNLLLKEGTAVGGASSPGGSSKSNP
jgi:hyperosmotically inducible periplasmic protein